MIMASGKRFRIVFTLSDERAGEFDMAFNDRLASEDVLDHMTSVAMSVGRVFPEACVLGSRVSEICLDCSTLTETTKLTSKCRCCPEPKEKIND